MFNEKVRKTILEHIIVIETYVLFTIIVFHRIFALGINKWVIGDHGDAWQFIWNFWWVKKCILEGRDIFYTDYLFYPYGTHLYFHTLNLSGIFMVLPLLLWLDNLLPVYNVAVFLTFILSGYFMYLFLKYWLKVENNIKNESLIVPISFVGGCMYAFSPYVVSKALGYFNLLSIQWFPLSVLVSFKVLNKPNIKNCLLLTASIVLLFFADFHYFYYFFIFFGMFFIFNWKRFRKEWVFSVITGILILSLVYFPAFEMYNSSKNAYVRPYFQTITVYNYFLPSPFTLLYELVPNDLLSLYTLSEHYMWVDSVVYIGVGLLIFTLMISFLSRDLAKDVIKKNVWLIVLLLFSFLISLGKSNPLSLVVNNILRRVLPFFDLLPTPARHSFLVQTSFTLLSSAIISKFLMYKGFKIRIFSILIMVFLFLIEYFPLRFDSYFRVSVPSILYEIKNDERFFTILNIPHKGNTQGMYLQTVHKKKIIDGFVSRADSKSSTTLDRLANEIAECNSTKIRKTMNELGVRYIIVNYNYYPGYDFSFTKLFNCSKNLKRIERRGRIIVYEVV